MSFMTFFTINNDCSWLFMIFHDSHFLFSWVSWCFMVFMFFMSCPELLHEFHEFHAVSWFLGCFMSPWFFMMFMFSHDVPWCSWCSWFFCEENLILSEKKIMTMEIHLWDWIVRTSKHACWDAWDLKLLTYEHTCDISKIKLSHLTKNDDKLWDGILMF